MTSSRREVRTKRVFVCLGGTPCELSRARPSRKSAAAMHEYKGALIERDRVFDDFQDVRKDVGLVDKAFHASQSHSGSDLRI